jgi:hypothetical protein
MRVKTIQRVVVACICIGLLSGCGWSNKAKVTAIVGGVIGVGLLVSNSKKKSDDTDVKQVKEVKNISGTIVTLGGALIDSTHVLHVTHWPIKYNQIVKFKGNDGSIATRKIINKSIISPNITGADISILTLDTPLDLSNHDILEIAKPVKGERVTIYRIRRDPFTTTIDGIGDDMLSAKAGDRENSAIESGDSGKVWLNTKGQLVSLTSKGWWGEGPNLWEWKSRILKHVNKIEPTK